MYDDRELKEYRDLLKPPSHFEEGFDWKTIVGAVFIGFLMMPGSMYLQLVLGTGIGPAARWVTIILFAEIAKRSYTELKQQEIFLLYYMAGAALASPFQGLLWNQYLIQSDAAQMLGLTEFIPSWVAPGLDSSTYADRTYLHRDWLAPILLLCGAQLIQRIDQFGLGYALFRHLVIDDCQRCVLLSTGGSPRDVLQSDVDRLIALKLHVVGDRHRKRLVRCVAIAPDQRARCRLIVRARYRTSIRRRIVCARRAIAAARANHRDRRGRSAFTNRISRR